MPIREEAPQDRFERILAEHGAALGRLAAIYANDAAERDDLLQEILLAVWRALPTFRGEASERTFVFRIGHNRGLTYRARRRSRDRARAPIDAAAAVADPRADPHRLLTATMEQECLLRTVRALPEGVRQVVLLQLEGLSHREMADILGISENDVAVRLTRGRAALRRQLTPGTVTR